MPICKPAASATVASLVSACAARPPLDSATAFANAASVPAIGSASAAQRETLYSWSEHRHLRLGGRSPCANTLSISQNAYGLCSIRHPRLQQTRREISRSTI
jgi:hypothetical protein